MNDTDLAELIVSDRDDNELIDAACLKRLLALSDEHGAAGVPINQILTAVAALLNIRTV